MNVGVYNPYHESLGGGEQYMFAFALYFLQKKHKVIYYTNDKEEIQRAQDRFGFDLSGIRVQNDIFQKSSIISKISETKKLDYLLFYSDGSIPWAWAKKNYLVFQFPVPWVNGTNIKNRIKLKNINGVLVNSKFTKKFIDQEFKLESKVVYPYIKLEREENSKKDKVILSVGRFTSAMNTKRQDVLIAAFKKLYDTGLTDWKLVLTGGTRKDDLEFVEKLKLDCAAYPIVVIPDISRKELINLYNRSLIYWHAAGFGVDENKHPEKVEHFGISTIEAMASGCVPMVYPAGGQKEIISHNVNGLYWESIDELVDLTCNIIKDKKLQNMLSQEAINSSKQYSEASFDKTVQSILKI